MDIEELRRQERVIDLMLTAHSILRDRNQNYAIFFDLILLITSVLLCASVFVGNELFVFLGIDQDIARFVIGICTLIVFIISLIAFRVDWKQKAERHGQAAEKLSQLKADCRGLLNAQDHFGTEQIKNLYQSNCLILNGLAKIPDNKFLNLKAAHIRKVELSKMIDGNPGTPLFVLRLKMWIKPTLKSLFHS